MVTKRRSNVTRKPRKKQSKRPKSKLKLPPEPLSRQEVISLIGACSTRSPTGLRNRALIVTMWRSGLRVSEALSLRVADLERGDKVDSLRVLHGKGDKARTAHIDKDATEYIDRWIDVRHNLKPEPGAPMFCTLSGDRLGNDYVRHLFKRLARKAGIEKRVHPHGLRHTHAVELRREGVDIKVISTQLGHSSVATTARYLDHIAPEDVAKAIARRSIVDKPKRKKGKKR